MGRLLRDERIDCRLLGYFRWVRRGGKPEFVGLAKTAITAAYLLPDPTEVDEPTDTAFFIDAGDVAALKAGIDELLARASAFAAVLDRAHVSAGTLRRSGVSGISVVVAPVA